MSVKKIIYSLAIFCAIGCSGNVNPGSWTIVDTEDVLGVNLNIKPKR